MAAPAVPAALRTRVRPLPRFPPRARHVSGAPGAQSAALVWPQAKPGALEAGGDFVRSLPESAPPALCRPQAVQGHPAEWGASGGLLFFGLNNRSLFSQDSGGWKPEIRCWQGWSHSEASLLGGFQAAPFCSIVTRSSQCVHVCLTSFVCVCVLLRYH